MKTKVFATLIAAAVATTALSMSPITGSDTAHAQSGSLAGQKGKVRMRLPNGHGDCVKAVQRYIKAGGHSAYAQIAYDHSSERGGICSSAINRKSVKEAEAMALRGCEQGTKKWKFAYSGNCKIAATK